MANPANARINGRNVTQLDRLNVREALYVEGSLVRSEAANNVVTVTESSDLDGDLSSDVIYFVPTMIDMGTTSIVVPAAGLNIIGHNANVSGLFSTENSFTLFTSPAGGSGNLFMDGLDISVSGTGSQVYDLTAVNGNEAVEVAQLNYTNCTSLGELTDYRQGLEDNTGRLGGTPELTFSGAWAGFRCTTSIALNMSDFTSLFKAGTSLTFDSRFITDINCNLPTNGALIDFSPSNFNRDESLIFNRAYVRRDDVIDPTDTTIYPNIDENSVKSDWGDNTGIPNTKKKIKGVCTAEVTTTINTIDVYEVLLGTITIETSSHFDEPANGEYRLLTGSGDFNVQGNISIDGSPSDVLDLRVTKSTDGGSTFPIEVNHIRYPVNNLAGGRDLAIFPVNFFVDLAEGDRIRLEIENKSTTNNVTQVADSFLVVTEI